LPKKIRRLFTKYANKRKRWDANRLRLATKYGIPITKPQTNPRA
jgi:hypothetical protein